MRRTWIGPALALGLQCAALPVALAGESDAVAPPQLRFVADPALVRDVDPTARAGMPAAPQVSTPPSDDKTSKPAANWAASTTDATKPAAPASWPVTLKEIHAQRAASGKIEQWSPAEVQSARLRCAAVLKAINGVAEIEEPMRIGSCGTPAPIRLISFGRKPEVVISPPALINCDMAEALHKWFTGSLQPLARKHLGAPIIKIDKMSDYSCRNAYGRARGRLSEHGRANALDIAGFSTAKGDSAMLLADWGMTARDIRRQIAEAQKKAGPVTHIGAAETHVPAPPQTGTPAAAPPAETARTSVVARPTIVEGTGPRGQGSALSYAGSDRDDADEGRGPLDGLIGKLGGHVPRQEKPAASVVQLARDIKIEAPVGADKAQFLREAHSTACAIFGTVLGPEANNAHRNHLHIDLATRGATGAFCE